MTTANVIIKGRGRKILSFSLDILNNVSSMKYNSLKIWYLAKFLVTLQWIKTMKLKNFSMITEDKVTEIFCIADDFCKVFDAQMANI